MSLNGDRRRIIGQALARDRRPADLSQRRIVLRSSATAEMETMTASTGEFTLRDVPAGRYSLELSLPALEIETPELSLT